MKRKRGGKRREKGEGVREGNEEENKEGREKGVVCGSRKGGMEKIGEKQQNMGI